MTDYFQQRLSVRQVDSSENSRWKERENYQNNAATLRSRTPTDLTSYQKPVPTIHKQISTFARQLDEACSQMKSISFRSRHEPRKEPSKELHHVDRSGSADDIARNLERVKVQHTEQMNRVFGQTRKSMDTQKFGKVGPNTQRNADIITVAKETSHYEPAVTANFKSQIKVFDEEDMDENLKHALTN